MYDSQCSWCLEDYADSVDGFCWFCRQVNESEADASHKSELTGWLDNLSPDDPLCYVYVLATDEGSYVGHTADLERRVREHHVGRVKSTAGTNPSLVWDRLMLTRAHADACERVLKTLRDHDKNVFYYLTRVGPQEWTGLGNVAEREQLRLEREQRNAELLEQLNREQGQRAEQLRLEREQSQRAREGRSRELAEQRRDRVEQLRNRQEQEDASSGKHLLLWASLLMVVLVLTFTLAFCGTT
ncbi:MAG: hypothetical protein J4G14_14825 [Dehalococcoidia bacterium]|nr:hypothetical protein [Dehalococcoidia bacterium]